MTPGERIRRLIESGAVGREEGERLLAAIATEPRPRGVRLLVNPFERFGGGVATALGAAVACLSVLVSRAGIRFDGLLDLHVRKTSTPLVTALVDQAVAWVLPALLFWCCARAHTRHVRAIDFFGMTGLARVPLLLAAIPFAFILRSVELPHGGSVQITPGLLAGALFALPCIVWNVALLYQGFKNASGLRGAKLVGSFIGMTILAEVVSKVLVAVVPLTEGK